MGAVVHGEDLQVGDVLREERAHRALDGGGLVPARHDRGDGGERAGAGRRQGEQRAAVRAADPPEQAPPDEGQRGGGEGERAHPPVVPRPACRLTAAPRGARGIRPRAVRERVERERPAVAGGDRGYPRPLADCERHLLGAGPQHLHPEVREHRESRADRADEELGVVRAEVEDAAIAPDRPRRVHDEEVHAAVRLGEPIEPVGVHDVRGGEPRRGEPVAVRLHAVVVGEGRLEHDPGPELVAAPLGEDPAARDEPLRVALDHRLDLERVAGREQDPARREPAAAHRLDDRGRVSGVVEVPMGEDEHVGRGGIEPRPRGEGAHQRARPGVHPDAEPAERPHEPARVAELRRDGEARARRAEELQAVGALAADHGEDVTRAPSAGSGTPRLNT